jgi:hypothetical protein
MNNEIIFEWVKNIAWQVEDLIQNRWAVSEFRDAVQKCIESRHEELRALTDWVAELDKHLERVARDKALRDTKRPPDKNWELETKPLRISRCWMPEDPRARGKWARRRAEFFLHDVLENASLLNKRKQPQAKLIWGEAHVPPGLTVECWVPPGLQYADKPQIKRLLPLNQNEPLAIKDKYVCLAVAHDLVCPAKGVEAIGLWPQEQSSDQKERSKFVAGYPYTLMINMGKFSEDDEPAFSQMLKEVETDLEEKGFTYKDEYKWTVTQIAKRYLCSTSYITQLCNKKLIKSKGKRDKRRVSLASAAGYFATTQRRRRRKNKSV